MRGKVDFKGTKDGIVLYIKGDLSFDWIQILVQRKLKLARHFFEGAHIIGSSGYLFTEEQEAVLAQLIQAQSGMKVLNLEPFDFKREQIEKNSKWDTLPTVRPVVEIDQSPTCESSTEAEAQDMEVAEDEVVHMDSGEVDTLGSSDQEEQSDDESEVTSAHPLETEEDEQTDNVESFAYGLTASHEESSVYVSDTIFHRGTLRSGRRIDSKGNIVVLGDVNPGAELSARGNIIVMGNMRGQAHAGVDGNTDAFIAAIRLMPTQIRIHKVISRPPDDPEKMGHNDPQYPEIAYIKEGQIIIEPYL